MPTHDLASVKRLLLLAAIMMAGLGRSPAVFASEDCPRCGIGITVLSARAAINHPVIAGEFFFSNMSVTVNIGDTVTWTNNGSIAHTTTSDSGVWNSPTMNPGDTFSYTFNTAGTFPYHCSIHAATMKGTINVVGPPQITSPATATVRAGAFFTYTIQANGNPTSFNAGGLPSGVTFDPTTGVISGRPAMSGIFTVTLSATNSMGTGTGTLVLTVTPPPPTITSANTASTVEGGLFGYQITATDAPTSFNATGLPAGLTIDNSNGLISGSPTVYGTFRITLSATNASGTGTGVLDLTISPLPPVISSPVTASGTVGAPFSYTIEANNEATSFAAVGLPAGMSVDPATGIISGIPAVAGTAAVTLSATNVTGTGVAPLTLNIATPAAGSPVITIATPASGTLGSSFSYGITATNSPTGFSASGLPAGLSLNSSTGVIAGAPTVAGIFDVTISASNAAGTNATTLSISIAAPPARDKNDDLRHCGSGSGFSVLMMLLLLGLGATSAFRRLGRQR